MADPTELTTPLHGWHAAHGGRMVEFGGWSMPVQYSTIVEEHRAVRERVGLFDIGHMGRLEFLQPGSLDLLEHLTTNRVASLADGQIQYSLIANEQGGIVDDILVYRRSESRGFLVVCNASNRSKVTAHFGQFAGTSTSPFDDTTLSTTMFALQGPKALATLQGLCETSLKEQKYYHFMRARLDGRIEATISRTGYTGEDGFELIVKNADAESVWEKLLAAGQSHGILACGLGARDTLRFEAAMPLYGHELDEQINPYSAGLGWVVKLNKGDFIGRAHLTQFKQTPGRIRVGLALEGKRIARQGSIVESGEAEVGVVTSGTFSPTLQASLAMAYVEPAFQSLGSALHVDVRGHREPARVVELPFYRRPR